MGKEIPLHDIVDAEGFRLPKNMSTQFRQVQTGIEYLKGSADNITVELKGVNNKLKANTTDLSEITKKVNSIDNTLKKHLQETKKSFRSLEKTNGALLDLMQTVYTAVENQKERIEALEKK